MDGDRVAARQAAAAVAHAETCTRCRTFSERSARIRSAVRIRAAEQVPDLVEPDHGRRRTKSGFESTPRPIDRQVATWRLPATAPPPPEGRPRARRRRGGRGSDPRQRAGGGTVAERREPPDRGGDRRAERAHRRADARRLPGRVHDPRVRPVSRGTGTSPRDGGGLPFPATVPPRGPRPDDLPVPFLDPDPPPLHPGRDDDVHVGSIRVPRRPPRPRVPPNARRGDASLRVLRGGSPAGGPRPPGRHVRIRDGVRRPRVGSDRRPGRDPRPPLLRAGGSVVPVPADGRDVEAVLRP